MPGGFRAFDLDEEGLGAGQGGDTDCEGLPVDGDGTDWVVNITVTGFSANGALKVWRSNMAEPDASVINYSAGHAPSVANWRDRARMFRLPGTLRVYRDIRVEALGSPTHVIVDVSVTSQLIDTVARAAAGARGGDIADTASGSNACAA